MALWDKLNIVLELRSVGEVNGLISCSSEVSNLIRPAKVIEQLLLKLFFFEIHSFMPFLPSEERFWPLTASITSEFKSNYVHATMVGVLN